jgi:3-oxoacyl-[acyl-carrier protein] reductase
MSLNKNKVALVTGATKGMGKAISFALVKEGYTLIACARKQDTLEQLQSDIKNSLPDARIFIQACDFSEPAQIEALLNWVDKNSLQVDVLVNNVGLFIPGKLLEEPADVLAKQMQVNLFTPHQLSVHLGMKMRENKSGHIFMITSVASRNAVVSAGSYSVTKYALAGLTAVLRKELRASHVKVTEIIPGSTLTSSWEGTSIPEEEFVLPEDIAQALVAALNMSSGANVDEIIIKPVKGNL